MPAPREASAALRARQRTFFALTCDPRPWPDALGAHASSNTELLPARRWIAASSEHGAQRRLEIYNGMRFYRVLESLREDFGSAYAVLGDSSFAKLVRAYVAAHPSRSPSLRDLGAALPDFVRAQACVEPLPPFCGRADLADLCALDWARLSVFDAPDVMPLREQDLTVIPTDAWPSFRVRLLPAHLILHAEHAIDGVWLALDRHEPAPAPDRTPQALLVWKLGFDVRHVRVDTPERETLEAAAHGLSLAALCERFADGAAPESASEHVFRLLRQWLVNGWLVAEA